MAWVLRLCHLLCIYYSTELGRCQISIYWNPTRVGGMDFENRFVGLKKLFCEIKNSFRGDLFPGTASLVGGHCPRTKTIPRLLQIGYKCNRLVTLKEKSSNLLVITFWLQKKQK
jgi:hypothetical protein